MTKHYIARCNLCSAVFFDPAETCGCHPCFHEQMTKVPQLRCVSCNAVWVDDGKTWGCVCQYPEAANIVEV